MRYVLEDTSVLTLAQHHELAFFTFLFTFILQPLTLIN